MNNIIPSIYDPQQQPVNVEVNSNTYTGKVEEVPSELPYIRFREGDRIWDPDKISLRSNVKFEKANLDDLTHFPISGREYDSSGAERKISRIEKEGWSYKAPLCIKLDEEYAVIDGNSYLEAVRSLEDQINIQDGVWVRIYQNDLEDSVSKFFVEHVPASPEYDGESYYNRPEIGRTIENFNEMHSEIELQNVSALPRIEKWAEELDIEIAWS